MVIFNFFSSDIILTKLFFNIIGCENVGKTTFKKALTSLSNNNEKIQKELSMKKREEMMVISYSFFLSSKII